MIKINESAIQKKVNDAVRSRIKRILTPEEFEKVQFIETETKLGWKTTKEIGDKISSGLKNDT